MTPDSADMRTLGLPQFKKHWKKIKPFLKPGTFSEAT